MLLNSVKLSTFQLFHYGEFLALSRVLSGERWPGLEMDWGWGFHWLKGHLSYWGNSNRMAEMITFWKQKRRKWIATRSQISCASSVAANSLICWNKPKALEINCKINPLKRLLTFPSVRQKLNEKAFALFQPSSFMTKRFQVLRYVWLKFLCTRGTRPPSSIAEKW